MNETDVIFGLLVLVAGLVIALVVAIVKRTPIAQVDADAAARIDAIDRAQRDLLERQYAAANDILKRAIDVAGVLVTTVSKLTPAKTDDAIAELITDIQTPGAPESKPADPEPPALG